MSGWLEIAADYRCNQRCLGCPAVSEGGPSLSSAQLMASLLQGRREGITQLWIGGGEPTLRPELLGLVREARKRGYTRVRIQTNAAMLSYAGHCEKLAAAGATELSVSIKGADAAVHDGFARSPGAFDLLCRAIENARATGMIVEGDILLYRSSTGSLPAIVRAFFARGIERFRVWSMAPDARDGQALAEEPLLSDVARAVEATLALGLSSDPEHLVALHLPPCTLSEDAARARFYPPDLGLSIHDASGAQFRLEDSPMEGGAFSPRCQGCALRTRCNGLRAEYLRRHGDGELAPR